MELIEELKRFDGHLPVLTDHQAIDYVCLGNALRTSGAHQTVVDLLSRRPESPPLKETFVYFSETAP